MKYVHLIDEVKEGDDVIHKVNNAHMLLNFQAFMPA